MASWNVGSTAEQYPEADILRVVVDTNMWCLEPYSRCSHRTTISLGTISVSTQADYDCEWHMYRACRVSPEIFELVVSESDGSRLKKEKTAWQRSSKPCSLLHLHTPGHCMELVWLLELYFWKSYKLDSAPSNYTHRKGVADAVGWSGKLLVSLAPVRQLAGNYKEKKKL